MQSIKAIYENGVFRPLEKPNLNEGESVQITVEYTTRSNPEKILKLAADVYEGLSPADIDEIEEIALQRNNFFAAQTEQ
ncbi:antitoxin family protein [Aetokthonos hydrillicola Thurmond2011]|jgi:predicted DNA-binding antitoxin AbrB/MazE fold protein|uniref:Antitoxin family protein n=1 Tax=Aetokthonos hydrillicola Thurmond2011 TaxID=2712845 RepID=A0AAP5I9R9_9CYAN|nr:antitoxin family protein [Aetokthonos hydrillicola]MBO3458801.1 antitoxin family protein [Aetokthonos hydrillicola CCALA 1050]MBW4585548.1 antitoxin family protein [Aetokthonos hydrillicola CCALA 1050]MDR9896172.1 antitoxin family protein [Aetokthonos hydrillicola Thurmond2011]